MDSKSFQNYQLVKDLMDDMREIFDEYLKIIEAVNTDVEEGINNGSDSALDSQAVGKPFKDQWEALYTDFKNLELFFADVYAKVGNVTTNNAELEEYGAELFGYSGDVNTTNSSQSTILNGTDSSSSGGPGSENLGGSSGSTGSLELNGTKMSSQVTQTAMQ